ncbi:MAG: serine hydrolase domain-containing protein [Dermatophilaceae bacterium]
MRPKTGKRRFAAVLLAGALAAVTAQGAPAAAAPTAGAPVEAVPAVESAFADQLDASLDAVTAAGAIGAVGYSRGADRSTWAGAAGVRTIDGAQPARARDRVRVASVTKAMVATVAMQEVDRGRWTLRTTVGDVLPGLVPEHEDITLEQLLSHRSGLPDYVAPALGADVTTVESLLAALKRTRTDAELVRAALTQPMLFEPGTGFGYSNTNYVVTGMMLEKATGRSMAGLLEQRVFQPAGMSTARFDDSGRGFTGRDHLSDYGTYERPYNFDPTNLTILSSAGAVVANAPDIAAFYRALFAGRLVSKRSLSELVRPRTTDPKLEALRMYALGIYQVSDPCPAADGSAKPLYGHGGDSFGTSTLVFTSADGSRQASVASTGRQWASEQQPIRAAADEFIADAFASTCTTTVPDAARARTMDELEKRSRDLDSQLAARQFATRMAG